MQSVNDQSLSAARRCASIPASNRDRLAGSNSCIGSVSTVVAMSCPRARTACREKWLIVSSNTYSLTRSGSGQCAGPADGAFVQLVPTIEECDEVSGVDEDHGSVRLG